jgi:Cupin-like domain
MSANASTALKQSVGHESLSSSSSSSSSSKATGKLKEPTSATEEGEEEGQGISITNAASHSLAGDSTSIGSPPNFSKVDTALPLESLKVMFPLYYEALTNSSIKIGRTGSCSSSSSGNSCSSSSSSSSSNGAILPSVKTSDCSKSSDHSTLPSSIVSRSGVRCMEVTIKAGEMLFIPAGWFHEVRSTGGGKVGHLALNYWFHPPDGSTFEKPYTSDFWVNDWKRRNLE